MRLALALVAVLALASFATDGAAAAARKRGPGKPTPDRMEENCQDLAGDRLEACRVIGTYLDLVKAQKWDAAKKLIHPKTIEVIAQTKKTAGDERHAMAPWYWAKHTYFVTDWKLGELEESLNGTVQLTAVETRYQVEEDGMSEGEESTYIAGKWQGTWYVVDVQRGGGAFHPSSIRVGMKGYFDEPARVEDEPASTPAAKSDPPKTENEIKSDPPRTEAEAEPDVERTAEAE